MKVWSNSVSKYPEYFANNVCLILTHGRTDARTHEHWEHNAFGHYVGGGIKHLIVTFAIVYDTINDLHWKNRQASCQFNLTHKLLKTENVLNERRETALKFAS